MWPSTDGSVKFLTNLLFKIHSWSSVKLLENDVDISIDVGLCQPKGIEYSISCCSCWECANKKHIPFYSNGS